MLNLEEFILFQKGTIPLVISVPHDSIIECKDIPKRKNGVLGIDKGTIKLAKDLIQNIKDISSEIPSCIILKVHRSKIDVNREKIKAYNGESSLARRIYQYYHILLRKIIRENIRSFKKSLLVDIHGFKKHKRPPGFRDVEIILGTNNLNSLFSEPIPKGDRDKNIRGRIINKFLEFNIPIAPGHPKRKEYVLTGGYITQSYGASKLNKSQALQIEFSDNLRLYDKNLRNLVLNELSNILIEESSLN